jgi:hypothetical protein
MPYQLGSNVPNSMIETAYATDKREREFDEDKYIEDSYEYYLKNQQEEPEEYRTTEEIIESSDMEFFSDISRAEWARIKAEKGDELVINQLTKHSKR